VIISISDPENPDKINIIDCSILCAGVNSVAAKSGLVVAAIEAEAKQGSPEVKPQRGEEASLGILISTNEISGIATIFKISMKCHIFSE